MNEADHDRTLPWYRDLTRRHWLLLGVAWLGWVFDLMDVYLLVLYKQSIMRDLLGGAAADPKAVDLYSGYALSLTLVGWSVGGLVFGIVADRWGRTRTMALTILLYSLFTGLAGFTQTWGQFAACRFLAALGIGGEWGSGASMIAEVFPRRSRAIAAGIMQSASASGFFAATFLFWGLSAWAPGEAEWRWAFFIGATPAFLALVVRAGLHEPEAWTAARARAQTDLKARLGSLAALFGEPELRRRTLVATGLALTGIFAYWGTAFWAPESLKDLLGRTVDDPALRKGLQARGILCTHLGALAGFLLFIPLAQRFGRKPAFAAFHLGSLIAVPAAFLFAGSYAAWIALFVVAAIFTNGIFSGYTICFPELFPTRLRATGAGFCYNVGRIVAAGGPVLMGWLKGAVDGVAVAGALMGGVYVLGFLFLPALPETRGVDLDQELN